MFLPTLLTISGAYALVVKSVPSLLTICKPLKVKSLSVILAVLVSELPIVLVMIKPQNESLIFGTLPLNVDEVI